MTVLGSPHKNPNIELDPTRAATRKPWSPMTPEQLEAYRQPVVQRAETPEQEARRISYSCGVSALAPLILRVIRLERELAELKSKLPA